MKDMTPLGEFFAARTVERRSGTFRRAEAERRGDSRSRVPFERRRAADRRQLVGRRQGEHRPHITIAELKVLLGR